MSESDRLFSPEITAAIHRDYLAMIELDRRRWEATANPLYVWRAIDLCFRIAQLDMPRADARRLPLSSANPFPSWCMEYLHRTAVRFGALAEGQDFHQLPKPIGEQEPSAEGWKQAIEGGAELPPEDAARLVPAALGTSREGWNAFQAAASLAGKELDEFSDFVLREDGLKPRQRMDTLLEEAGMTDERTMRRRLAEAREATRGKPGG